MSPGRRLVPLLAAGACVCAGTAAAQMPAPPRADADTPGPVRALLGQWDIEQIGAPRRCTITFGAEVAGHGRQIRFPATCRRALPVLGGVASWSVTAEGHPRLDDAQGRAVIAFGKASAGGLQGSGPGGERYGLDPAGHPRARRETPPTPAQSAAMAASRPTVVDPATAPAPETLPGRYVLMRQRDREACRFELTQEPRKALGGLVARFVGTCADTGLSIFNPVGWRYEAGRLELIASRGHTVELVFEDGVWRKDPAIGAPLLMRRQP